MNLSKCNTGQDVLTEVLKSLDLKAMPDETLILVFSKLFDLEKKKLNFLEKAYLSGRIKQIIQNNNLQRYVRK
jgi:hypothetical protein